MTSLLRSPRPLVHLGTVLVTSLALTGCPSDPSGDGDDDGTDDGPGEPQACIDPGSPLLDSTKAPGLPGDDAMPFTCSSGWATDAPQQDPTWTIEVPVDASEFGFVAMTMDAHPEGGVVIAGSGLFARYDENGDEVWSTPGIIAPEVQLTLLVEVDGSIILAVYDWSTESGTVTRYAADGSEMGAVPIPWNDANGGEVWGLQRNGDELIVGAFDQDMEGVFETTLMRLAADGTLLLRKSTNMTNSGQLAVNDAGSVAFGRFPTFLLSLDSGAVQGNLTPSAGGLNDVAGFGSDFVMVGGSQGDFSVGRYSEIGVERWLQTYDRASFGDNGRAIAVGPDETIVVVGSTSVLDSASVTWFGSQPWIVAVDADGNALWSDRIAAYGDATQVAFGSGGEVYVLGLAEGLEANEFGEPELVTWLRRYQ